MPSFYALCRLWLYLILRGGEHIFNKYSVPGCRIVYQHVRHRADELSVFDAGRATRECGQVGTTNFSVFIFLYRKLFSFG